MIYVCGPGHGAPAVVSNVYLEGTYSEVYPNISQDEAGLKKLFRQFSFPEGSPVTFRRKRRGRSMRVASWGIRSAMHSEPHSITRTWSSPASSETEKPRPAHWRPHGTPTSSSTQ